MGKIDPTLAQIEAAHAFRLEDADFADDGAEAAGHLAEGRAIYFRDGSTPAGKVVRQGPDGRRELVEVAPDGSFRVIGPG